MNAFIKNTLVVDRHSDDRLTLDIIAKKVREEINPPPTKLEVYHAIPQVHPQVEYSNDRTHSEEHPRAKYKLRWLTSEEKKEHTSILICATTRLEADLLRPLLKTSENIPIRDCDIKKLDIGFNSNFTELVALAEATQWNGSTMSGMTKTLLYTFPNLEKAYQTGPCDAPLNMGTIIVADQNIHGLVCEDYREESDWKVQPGFPSETLAQICHRVGQEDIPVFRTPISSGGRKLLEPPALPYSLVSGGFISALHRTGFIREGHEAGIASVVDENFSIPGSTACTIEISTGNLREFWKMFLDSL